MPLLKLTVNVTSCFAHFNNKEKKALSLYYLEVKGLESPGYPNAPLLSDTFDPWRLSLPCWTSVINTISSESVDAELGPHTVGLPKLTWNPLRTVSGCSTLQSDMK